MKYPNDLKDSVVFPLYLVSKEIIRKYNLELSKLDLTYTQYLVLMYFYHEKESNLKQTGKVMMLDSSTLTPLLKKLEKKGLITRDKSTEDERNLVIKITKKGEDLVPKLRKIRSYIKEKIDISDEETNTIRELTLRILKNIDRK